MSNPYFKFKKFTVFHDQCAMKVGTDGVLLGAWCKVSGTEENILDIGTGSGLIALMLAQRCHNAQINGIDIDANAALQAAYNFGASPWKERLQAQNISIQHFCDKNNCKYDLLVSNPPYFINSLKNPQAGRSLARHTDTLSYEELILASVKLLKASGHLCVILPAEYCDIFTEKAYCSGLYLTQKMVVYPTLTSLPKRVLLCLSPQQQTYTETALTIEVAGRHGYSEEYKKLTEDFYL